MDAEAQVHVKINFCGECNNMLYAKEDKQNQILIYACRNCTYTTPAENPCVYVNCLQQEIDELKLIVSDVVYDPTLPRTDHTCDKCNGNEAVFFQSQTLKAEENMRLYYVCTNPDCLYTWTE
ncbi:DNA-directed RNA polymerase II subunit RPB9 [Cichlidogyrus casuarinus]|uniref:DNA-directed RNA polymerase subunit n=1 Tax=Cichlidogyrus casuarinus TaxID=1844966 RepID=A0ABD2QNB7_9PLAT